MEHEELEDRIFQDGYNAGSHDRWFGYQKEMSGTSEQKLNLFDLLGFLPGELEEFKGYALRAQNMLEDLGAEEFLRTVGHGSNKSEREDFALGVYLGARIVEMMEAGGKD